MSEVDKEGFLLSGRFLSAYEKVNKSGEVSYYIDVLASNGAESHIQRVKTKRPTYWAAVPKDTPVVIPCRLYAPDSRIFVSEEV
ncbi:MAG: hypothetical protein Q4E77_08245 [Conchiformibius sp.]|nr:hypothetical protein [Conchiformibius sp.]